MENFKEYRNTEAAKLVQLRKVDPVSAHDYLEKIKSTEQYKEAEEKHRAESDFIRDLKKDLPKGFEVTSNQDGNIEITLVDQNDFTGWNEVVTKIKEKIVELVKLYDLEGKEDVYIEIKEPHIMEAQTNGDAFAVRFDKDGMNEDDFKRAQESDIVETSHFMSSYKPEALICHKGMVRSVTLS